MPTRIAAPPASWTGPSGSANTIVPRMAPTSGSRLRNAPATSADTRLSANANNVVGPTVPPMIRPAVASTAARLACPVCVPSDSSAIGSVPAAAAIS